MATFYALGKYTAQGYQGFCKDPKSDRAQAARTAAEAVGAKLVSYTGLMATEASGALCDIAVCEAININEVAENAAKIAKAYKGPGK